MASASQGADAPTSSTSNPADKPQDPALSSSPVELSALQSSGTEAKSSSPEDTTAGAQAPDTSAQSTTTDPQVGQPQPTLQVPSSSEPESKPAPLTRLQSEALGPATEDPTSPPVAAANTGPILSINLMLTTGAKHPYKIDEKYLRSRRVETSGNKTSSAFDPLEISGYKLKELIWTDWRSEWEPRPASPSSIRLIIMGRFIEDKAPLKDFPFKLDQTNVLHMTVKPADFEADEELGAKGAGKGHSIRGRDGEDRGAGCRCVIL